MRFNTKTHLLTGISDEETIALRGAVKLYIAHLAILPRTNTLDDPIDALEDAAHNVLLLLGED